MIVLIFINMLSYFLGASSEACIVPNSSVMFASNPASQQETSRKRKVEKSEKQKKSYPSSRKHQKVNSFFEQQRQPMFVVMQPATATHSTQISSRIVSQETRNQVVSTTPVQYQYSRNNTAELSDWPKQTLPTLVVQNFPPQQGHVAASDVQRDGVQVSQQPSSKNNIMIAAPGGSQQRYLPAPEAEKKENFEPVQRRQLEEQSHPSITVPFVWTLQGSPQTCLPLQPSAVPGTQGKLELIINYCMRQHDFEIFFLFYSTLQADWFM